MVPLPSSVRALFPQATGQVEGTDRERETDRQILALISKGNENHEKPAKAGEGSRSAVPLVDQRLSSSRIEVS